MINSATAAKLRAAAQSPAVLFEMLCWFPTAQRMPDVNRHVMTAYGGGMTYIMLWDGDRWHSSESPDAKPRRPKYWAYLPHGPITA